MPVDANETIDKIKRRLIPFLGLCLFASYLDRVNIGFAALTMNKDLGFSPLVFGLGSGIFFFGYAGFEVPSNYALARFGARLWIARIMISWGVVSALMAVTWNETSFLALRLLLGVAEAGFVPGVVLYLTYWMPTAYRAVAISAFMLAIPISSIVGAPLSGFILAEMGGVWGLKGWQWLFILEALPSIVLGVLALRVLIDKPQHADWLSAKETSWLQNELDKEHVALADGAGHSFLHSILNREVAVLSAIYFGVVTTLYALVFWLPQIVHSFGFDTIGTGFLSAIPYIFAAIAMTLWSRHVDRNGGHVKHVAIATLIAAVSLAATAAVHSAALTIVTLSFAAVGAFSVFPIFWTLVTARLPKQHATGAVAFINSVAALSGFCGPYLVGWVKDATGAFTLALPILALGPLISFLLLINIDRLCGTKRNS